MSRPSPPVARRRWFEAAFSLVVLIGVAECFGATGAEFTPWIFPVVRSADSDQLAAEAMWTSHEMASALNNWSVALDGATFSRPADPVSVCSSAVCDLWAAPPSRHRREVRHANSGEAVCVFTPPACWLSGPDLAPEIGMPGSLGDVFVMSAEPRTPPSPHILIVARPTTHLSGNCAEGASASDPASIPRSEPIASLGDSWD